MVRLGGISKNYLEKIQDQFRTSIQLMNLNRNKTFDIFDIFDL